jgi:hypothetical protein
LRLRLEIMGECERSSASVVYTARLLWRTVSSTRILVSVLNVERKNVSVSTTRHPEIKNQQRCQQNRDEKSWGSLGVPNVVKVRRKEVKTKRKRKERRSKLKCHLCKLVIFHLFHLPFPLFILTTKAQITNNPTPDSQTSHPPHTPPPPRPHQHITSPPHQNTNTPTHHPPTPSPYPTSQSPNPSPLTHHSAPLLYHTSNNSVGVKYILSQVLKRRWLR